jgi:hypothetical protein
MYVQMKTHTDIWYTAMGLHKTIQQETPIQSLALSNQ